MSVLGMLRLDRRSKLAELETTLSHIRQRLEFLNDHTPELSELVEQKGKLWTYTVEQGQFTAHSLRNEPKIAIAEGFAEANTYLQEHRHLDCKEWLCVLEGELHLTIEDQTHVLHPLETLEFDGSLPHKAFFPKRTRLITITIPSASGFPEEEAH